MSDLKPYLVKFDSEENMKKKIYSNDCQVGGKNWQLIIIIIYNECTFFTNNKKTHRWQCKGDTFLCLKGKGRGIMVFDFLQSFSRFNLIRLLEIKQNQVVEHFDLSNKEIVEI